MRRSARRFSVGYPESTAGDLMQSIPNDSANSSQVSAERIAVGINEAALMLGVGRSTVYNWLDAGKLPSVKVVGRRLIPVSALRSLIGEVAHVR